MKDLKERSLEEIKKEYNDLLNELTNPELISDLEKFEQLSRKKKFLEKIIQKKEELEDLKRKIEENKQILKSEKDWEILTVAEMELKEFQERKAVIEKEIEKLIKEESDSQKISEVIVEIRAGVGGEEAALFVADLYRMYSKFAKNQNWKIKVLDSHPTELGGFKHIIFELRNGDVFSKMKYEGGVHRVQRIPETEKKGRIHTSTASVAILPKPKKTEIKIRPEDLKIDFYRASGPGGQYVNKRETAVRITHLPTGIVVTSQTERNQLQNRENAMAILRAKLYELKEKEEKAKLDQQRKAQIKRGERSDKIRTYNFPQDRVTDHRIKKNFSNIEAILDGNLEEIIESLQKELE